MKANVVYLLLLPVAGACGTLARYGLGGVMQRLVGDAWPLGTWAVNILGSFLVGAIAVMATERGLLSADARNVLLIGFMGAFTTFSTLSFETVGMIQKGQWILATVNSCGQVVVGVAAVVLGMAAGRVV